MILNVTPKIASDCDLFAAGKAKNSAISTAEGGVLGSGHLRVVPPGNRSARFRVWACVCELALVFAILHGNVFSCLVCCLSLCLS